MRFRLLAVCLACGLAGPAVSFAQQAAKPADIVSMKALPADIRAALGDMSDRGGPFAPGCVSTHGEPHSRFSSARLGADTAQVTVERGGIAHFYGTLEFKKVDGRWVEQPKTTPPARG